MLLSVLFICSQPSVVSDQRSVGALFIQRHKSAPRLRRSDMRHLLVLSLILFAMSLFAVIAGAPPLAVTHARGYSCAGLKQALIPNTTITLAQENPASTNPPAPAHCE